MKQITASRDDIVFYNKLFPIVKLHPLAYNKSKAILCQGDNAKSLKMLEDAYAGLQLPEPACVTEAIKNNIDLAAKLNITGTPTVIFMDGSRSRGAMSQEALIKAIEARQGM